MKKLSVLLIIALIFAMVSCSSSSPSKPSDESTPATCHHTWNAATCIAPKTCTKCEITSGEALGHTTNSGTCSRCGEIFSEWEMGEYTDEFNQPTGKKYIIVDSYGTFSNSATTNSSLYAALQIDKDDIRIMMWEYNSNLVKGTFDYENYNITILDENNIKYYYTGVIYKGSTRINFADSDRNEIFNLLRNNHTLKIYLKSTKYSISTYLFTINTAGFSEAYASIS